MHLISLSFVFFYEMVIWVQPQDDIEVRLRNKGHLIYPQVLDMRGMKHFLGPRGKTPEWSEGRRQDQGDGLGHGPYWGFCGKGMAGHGDPFRIS